MGFEYPTNVFCRKSHFILSWYVQATSTVSSLEFDVSQLMCTASIPFLSSPPPLCHQGAFCRFSHLSLFSVTAAATETKLGSPSTWTSEDQIIFCPSEKSRIPEQFKAGSTMMLDIISHKLPICRIGLFDFFLPMWRRTG